MNPLAELNLYLSRAESALRRLSAARGSAILAGTALGATVLLALAMRAVSFSGTSIGLSRAVLFLAVAAALTAALIFPLLRINARRVARETARRNPQLGERLLTFAERRNSGDPFLPLLASDSLAYTSGTEASAIAAPSHTFAFASLALSAAAVLLWLTTRGPGFLGYGASLLWGLPSSDTQPIYSITLDPGDQRVRRHADQVVFAHLHGFFSHQAALFVRYASASRWEETAMRPGTDGASFDFPLVGIPEDLDYYVVSNGIHSPQAKLTAVDLPRITHLRVTYHFPDVYGRKDEREDPGGDLRALSGTLAKLEVETDKPLDTGSVVLDSGKTLALEGAGTLHRATIPIDTDGTYHFATRDGGQTVRLSDDYFIEARRDSPPTISILRPNRDARVTPIEEVPVELQARDDNGITALDLHFSINGGPEQTRNALGARGSKETHGGALLSMEEFKLVPGDIVTVYGTARDAKTTVRSDIYFIEARPFELTYRQEQASGSESGGQDDPKIAERQKEIIAATFNQIKEEKKVPATEAENARYLSGVQNKLKEEAQSLANRVKARQIQENNAQFQQFVTNIESAVGSMGPAADSLKDRKWQPALPPEQKALQYLLRAEAIFRDIQVQLSRNGSGGGGRGGASRDLEGLTNLELDTQKNQYESGSQSAQDQKQKETDEALKKLEELAKRQQALAEQQRSQPNFQQRWEQEMLRREAEQLRRKLEDLARDSSRQQQGNESQEGDQSQSGSDSESASSQGGKRSEGKQSASNRTPPQSAPSQSGSAGGKLSQASRQALEQALQNLTEAERKMGEAASHSDRGDAQTAADRLNRAEGALSQMRRQQNGSQMGDVQDQARKLAEKQRSFDERLRHNFAGGASANRTEKQNAQVSSAMSEEKRREIDDLHQLEHTLQNTARGMQNTQPEAAKKLRDAIGEMQQNEIESRMRWTADALNKGLGSYAVMREAPVTQQLEQLRDKLADAQSSMKSGDGNAKSPGENGEAMRAALERAEKLTRDLRGMSAGRNGRTPSNEEGGSTGKPSASSSSPGQTGQKSGPSGERSGSQTGTSSQGGPGPVGPAASGGWNAINRGGSPPDAATAQREYEEAVRELGRMQNAVRSDSATAKEIADLLRGLGKLDPRRFASDPARLAAIEAEVLADAERAELVLRRRLDEDRASVRTKAPDAVPPGYADAVAEYFRRLSR